VTARQYSHQAGPLLLVRPRVVGSLALPFDDKPRIYPIDLNATGRWRDSFDIAIPPGYVVDETPDPVSLDLDFASYHSSVSAKGNLLHYEREYVVRQVEIPRPKPPTSAILSRSFSPTKRTPPSSRSSNRSAFCKPQSWVPQVPILGPGKPRTPRTNWGAQFLSSVRSDADHAHHAPGMALGGAMGEEKFPLAACAAAYQMNCTGLEARCQQLAAVGFD
jgi:hypothetical protein